MHEFGPSPRKHHYHGGYNRDGRLRIDIIQRAHTCEISAGMIDSRNLLTY
jgi:hypothetical protein